MKKIVFLFVCLLFFACPVRAEYGFFHENDTLISLEGLLSYIGEEKVTRYKKAIDLKCDKTNYQCEILYATYVNNDNMEPSLYPTKKICKIISNQKDKKIIFCPSDFIYKIYVKEKKMTIEKDKPIFLLKWI